MREQIIRPEQLKGIIEAAAFTKREGVTVKHLKEVILEGIAVSNQKIKEIIEQLQQDYQGRGVQLVKTGNFYRFQTNNDYGELLNRSNQVSAPKYSRAAMETLALIAYQQPITRGEIEKVRGVSVSSHIIKTMIDRDWIKVVGHKEVPGRPALYATTTEFLSYFGLSSLSHLPELTQIESLEAMLKADAAAVLDVPEETEEYVNE
ncbi:SMC-Scp complex subunit ScpB [Paraferrimonas sp. SM1919]|uniref:SMC-Scp complex subunit ScpB n=1 Tax=Paraferrimonas sp. SM1919 TaxID=2662263 RepID=UPI0013D2B46E|nr:SMC-Scp complex subunit ScpB [Paraferrimonas sp. SM1919]